MGGAYLDSTLSVQHLAHELRCWSLSNWQQRHLLAQTAWQARGLAIRQKGLSLNELLKSNF